MEPDSRRPERALGLLLEVSRIFAAWSTEAHDVPLAPLARVLADHFGGACAVRLFDEGGVLRTAARHGSECWTDDALTAEGGVDRRARLVDRGGHGAGAAPLVAHGVALGVLVVARSEPYHPDDLPLLEDVAARIAHAVWARRSRDALEAAVRDGTNELRRIADSVTALVSYVGRDYRYAFVNRAYCAWFGRTVEEIVGREVHEIVGEEAAARILPRLTAALAGEAVSYETELIYPDAQARWTAVEYVPHRGVDGAVRGVVVLVREVTEARRAEERAGFLADASRVLSSSLDVDAALRALAEVAVPRIADLCVIQVIGEDHLRRPHTVHARDPAVAETVRTILRRWPAAASARPPRTFETGTYQLMQMTDEMLVAAAEDEEHLAAMRSLRTVSALVVAVPTSRGVYATLTLSSAKPRRRFDEADVELAREIAARTGLAIDNARLLREAREADRAKDEFLAMLAHELRNPLATIMTGLELVAEVGSPTPEVRRTLGAVERQTTKLARLVDDLLDVSRITRGKIELRREGCHLHPLIDAAIQATRSLVDARGLAVTVEVPEGISLLADPVRIEQVFANLLNNAAKYTEPGGRIRVEAVREGNVVRIAVSDDGIGIHEEVLPHVFQPFRQGAVGLDRTHGGLGLGLTLVERLVAMHDGTVEAASAGEGQGSTFTVRLPIVDVPVVPRSVPSRPAAITGRRRVLIVDDNADAAVATAELLTVFGHEVEVAHDGPMALRIAGRIAPEVILLDLGLPGMDGYEVASRLRAAGNRARIVALSGYGREQDRRDSRDAGFDGHLVKPVDAHTLLAAIADRLPGGVRSDA